MPVLDPLLAQFVEVLRAIDSRQVAIEARLGAALAQLGLASILNFEIARHQVVPQALLQEDVRVRVVYVVGATALVRLAPAGRASLLGLVTPSI